MPRMIGGQFMAETMKGYGVTHAFFVPVIARKAMIEMERLGIRRIMTHGEKSAAYMADGYARASNRVGVCMAQSVGAVNLAAGLQDAYLGLSPVVAITGHRPLMHQYRNSYQEIDHLQPFALLPNTVWWWTAWSSFLPCCGRPSGMRPPGLPRRYTWSCKEYLVT